MVGLEKVEARCHFARFASAGDPTQGARFGRRSGASRDDRATPAYLRTAEPSGSTRPRQAAFSVQAPVVVVVEDAALSAERFGQRPRAHVLLVHDVVFGVVEPKLLVAAIKRR